jgi:hypothetical protein
MSSLLLSLALVSIGASGREESVSLIPPLLPTEGFAPLIVRSFRMADIIRVIRLGV